MSDTNPEFHPRFELALRRIQECNGIKYAAYRTAAKLRILQRTLASDQLRLGIIAGVFERHKLLMTENSVQLDHNELENVLSDIYFVLQKEVLYDLDTNLATKLMSDFLYLVFDSCKKGTIQVLSVKIGLVVLCQAKPREKYQYFFNQLSDHNNCLSHKRLEVLLKKLIKVTEFLSENLSFGQDLIQATIDSCFKSYFGTLGITEDIFLTWLLQDPQMLVWLSTLYRMQVSEMVCHAAKCSVCKVYPIIGLRYRCLQCLSYNQCQTCFFTSKNSKNHKVKHPVQEYCCPITSKQSTVAFITTLKNKLRKTSPKLQYLPVDKEVTVNKTFTMGDSTKLLDEMELSTRTVFHGSRVSLHLNPQKELQRIILELEHGNKHFQTQIEKLGVLDDGGVNYKDCLKQHRTKVEAQVERLKLLKHYFTSNRQFGAGSTNSVMESTPAVARDKHLLRARRAELDTFSPIVSKNKTATQNLIWDNYDVEIHGEEDNINTSWEEVNNTVIPRTPGTGSWKDHTTSRAGITWLMEPTKPVQPDKPGDVKEAVELEELHEDLEDVLNKLQALLGHKLPEKDKLSSDELSLEKTADEVEAILNDLLRVQL